MLLDSFIVLFCIFALFRGRDIGFVRQLFSTIGFFGGLFLGALLEPKAVSLVHTAASRGVITISITLGMALVFLTLGEYAGIKLKHRLLVLAPLNRSDNVLGAGIGVVSLLISVWLIAAVASALPFLHIQSATQSSKIIRTLDNALPSAPDVISELGHIINQNGFPQVFIGNEPIPRGNVNLPSLGDLSAAVNADKDSIVKLAGTGCGGIVEGSGFVVSPGLIATNAHVVAGIKQPYVQDSNGNHPASVMWFDPALDFAVLRVSNLAGKPLSLAPATVSSGTTGAVVGYPGGGAFSAGPAAILDNFTASGRNIYGTGTTNRDIYEVQADVIPGNSGGPVIDHDGTVIGVIFAESTAYSHVGYALTTPAVTASINKAIIRNQVVSTGRCAE